ncbi:hypothetical protein [Bacillus sp. FJAT-29937]|uniref:hypothetical protein n=1 Tax=Bacillus sp. FJAT-29937 TaxID=1720553 RepID=UPI00082FBB43|nr:hypothetical protein [Bacillus sp. FJAT-29937]
MEKILYEILDQLKDHSKRFDKIDERFDAVDRRLDAMDQRFESIDRRFDAVDERLDSIDHRLYKLEETVQNNATEFRSHFKHIHSKLDQHDENFRIISENLKVATVGTKKNSTH